MIVVKFGGTSVANVSCIQRAANLVRDRYLKAGERVVVVVSAMAGVTDRLSGYLSAMTPLMREAEQDVVLSSGEPVTTALMAIALQELGYNSRSFLGWQLPIMTDQKAREARIIDISVGNLLNCFEQQIIPVVSGFQGISEQSRITTLGRGGSDLTAVALAAALQADRCDIYTDVNGIYTADPHRTPGARKLETISYEEILELSACGAKVLHTRSIELAMKHHLELRVLSSFVKGETPRDDCWTKEEKEETKEEEWKKGRKQEARWQGTRVGFFLKRRDKDNQEDQDAHKVDLGDANLLQSEQFFVDEYSREGYMESPNITGITTKANVLKFDLIVSYRDSQNLAKIIELFSKTQIAMNWLYQNSLSEADQKNVVSFLIDSADEEPMKAQCQRLKQNQDILDFAIEYDLARVSVIGIGIDSNTEVFYKIIDVLGKNKVNIRYLNVSPLSIRFLISKQDMNLASVALHTELGLANSV